MQDTKSRAPLLLVVITLMLSVLAILGLRLELNAQRRLGQGKAYVLKAAATVESVDAEGLSDKCLLAQGDIVRVDRIEPMRNGFRAVTITYAPVVRPPDGDDRRCPAGTSVIFAEEDIGRLVGKE